jgi:hypothetical protein
MQNIGVLQRPMRGLCVARSNSQLLHTAMHAGTRKVL